MTRTILTCILILSAVLSVCSTGDALTDTPFQIRTNRKNVIVWQNFGDWLLTTEDLAEGRVCYMYNPVKKVYSNLKSAMPGTWMPLGSAIKWLMYVDYYQNLDRLMAHDVDSGVYHIVSTSNQKQVGVGMADTTCIYGQYGDRVGDHYAVGLYKLDIVRGGITPFCISSSEKSQFAHDCNLIVYRANYGSGDIRICGIYFGGGDEFTITARPGFEPSVCWPLVAWYEPSGSGYNIMGINLVSGELRTIAYTTASPPRPEAGQGGIFWQDARNSGTTGIDIYGYDWNTRQEYPVTTATGSQLNLRVCGNLVTWTTGLTSNQVLWGARILEPVTISDLSVALVTDSSATLSWTSAGGSSDPPATYDLRMRTDVPITDANWGSSTPVTGLPAPQPVGQSESFVVQPLSEGHRHFALKVQLQSGAWSSISDSVCAYVGTEQSALRDAPEGASVSFTGVVSGIGVGDSFYCQRSDRSQAVKVILRTPQTLAVGQRITVTGTLAQDPDLRGPILGNSAVMLGASTDLVRPLGMSLVALGGFDSRYGGTDDGGPSNLWTRVRVFGRVAGLSTTSGCSFLLGDGSQLGDNSGMGVFVTSRFPAPTGLSNDDLVTVEGICRLSRTDGRQIEIVESTGITVW